MNIKKLLPVFLIIVIFSSAICTANATIVKEYEYDSYVDSTREFAFKVKIVIETEANDQWLVGNRYLVHFIVTPTYFNPHFFEPAGNFSFRFHSPEVYLWPDGVEKVLENRTANLELSETQMLIVECSPNVEKRQRLWACMRYTLYRNNEPVWTNAWDSWEPVYIEVKSPSLLSSELIFTSIGIILGVVLTSAFFMYKTRKNVQKERRSVA